jgi:DNA-binding GntR family transcriptional regulator
MEAVKGKMQHADLVRVRPITVPTTPEMIASQVRELIMDGTLAPGTQLTESRLASRRLLSRGPVREALQRLVQEGLLHDERHRGTFVTRLTSQDIVDIYEARIVIERAALQILATHRPTRSVFTRLDRLISEMRKGALRGDWAALTAADLKFHELVVAASKSKRLVRMYATLVVESGMCMAMMKPAYSNYERLVDEHVALYRAIDTMDAETLTVQIENHLRDAVNSLLEVSRNGGAPDQAMNR